MTGERGTAADIRIVFIILYFIKGDYTFPGNSLFSVLEF